MSFNDGNGPSGRELYSLMNDPSTLGARIFITNIPPQMVKQEIEENFSKYGRIVGIIPKTGFAFLQYESEHSAADAISTESGKIYYGKKIAVKPATLRKDPTVGAGPTDPMDRDRSPIRGGPPDMRDRPRDWRERERFEGPGGFNSRGGGGGRNIRGRGGLDRDPMDRFGRDDFRDQPGDFRGRPDDFRGPPNDFRGPPDDFRRPPDDFRGPPDDFRGPPDDFRGPPDDFRGPPKDFRGPPKDFRGPPKDFRGPPDDFRGPPDDFRGPPDDFRGPPDDFRGPPDGLRGGPDMGRDLDGPPRGRGGLEPRGLPADYPPAESPAPAAARSNDCEIIVVNKVVREYAEFIERRLIKIGLTVDLLFPNEEVPLGRVLANISGRGTLFAIIVNTTNEEHRSLTLNILYGQPQEHRNMPLEDALIFISRSFEVYIRGERAGPTAVGQIVPDRHPEAIQSLLNLLKENRQLTVLQYDKVIKYLQEKREIQIKLEVGDAQGLPSLTSDDRQPKTQQQADLQHRIMNILKQSGPGNQPPPQGVPSPWQQQQQSAPAAPAPLLNDPNVQKALDSLIQGDLLKKISPGNPGPVRPPLFGSYAGNRR